MFLLVKNDIFERKRKKNAGNPIKNNQDYNFLGQNYTINNNHNEEEDKIKPGAVNHSRVLKATPKLFEKIKILEYEE